MMDLSDISSLCRSSSKFNDLICNNQHFWMNKLIKEYGLDIENLKYFSSRYPYEGNYKKYYKFLRDELKDPNGALKRATSFQTNDYNLAILALKKGAIPKADEHEYLLPLVTGYGDMDLVKILIGKGFDIHVADDLPLISAIAKGRLDVVKYLIENSADIHSKNERPIRSSVMGNHIDIAKYLVNLGADIHVHNDILLKESVKYGYTDMENWIRSL